MLHGVLKVKTTEQKERERKAEAAKKIEAYKLITSTIFEKRKENVHTEEILELTDRALKSNGDVYTFYNYRRETLIALFEDLNNRHQTARDANDEPATTESAQKISTLIKQEFVFSQEMIAQYHKSYWAWNHRQWLNLNLPKFTRALPTPMSANWGHELELCNKLLSIDSRNFHCWNYRLFVVKEGKIDLNKELEFGKKKIEESFSNYSAWHHRAATIMKIHKEDPETLRKVIMEELNWIAAAFYTDDRDQSPWFYYRWLLNVVKPTEEVLKQQLEMFNELLELKPESKWVLLTKTFILSKMQERLVETLQHLDADHTQFYGEILTKATLPVV